MCAVLPFAAAVAKCAAVAAAGHPRRVSRPLRILAPQSCRPAHRRTRDWQLTCMLMPHPHPATLPSPLSLSPSALLAIATTGSSVGAPPAGDATLSPTLPSRQSSSDATPASSGNLAHPSPSEPRLRPAPLQPFHRASPCTKLKTIALPVGPADERRRLAWRVIQLANVHPFLPRGNDPLHAHSAQICARHSSAWGEHLHIAPASYSGILPLMRGLLRSPSQLLAWFLLTWCAVWQAAWMAVCLKFLDSLHHAAASAGRRRH